MARRHGPQNTFAVVLRGDPPFRGSHAQDHGDVGKACALRHRLRVVREFQRVIAPASDSFPAVSPCRISTRPIQNARTKPTIPVLVALVGATSPPMAKPYCVHRSWFVSPGTGAAVR